MTPLRQRMVEDMQLRNFSTGTQRSYIHYVEDFANHYRISPARLGLDEIRNYQLHLIEERRLSPQSVNGFVNAVKFLYTVTLEMPWSEEHFPRMKVPRTLPVVLSAGEVMQFFHCIGILEAQSDFNVVLRFQPAHLRGRIAQGRRHRFQAHAGGTPGQGMQRPLHGCSAAAYCC